jgi:hypothetical protein
VVGLASAATATHVVGDLLQFITLLASLYALYFLY